MSRLTLALDVMGGDVGPRITMPAAIKAVGDDPQLSLLLFGHRDQISPYLKQIPEHLKDVKERLVLCHTSKQIQSEDGILRAIRRSHDTSMYLALESVVKGEAQGCVSAGNTGALMGLAKRLVRPLFNIERPALMSIIPSLNNTPQVMLDLGANIDCSAKNLYQFALMGTIFVEQYFKLFHPRVALLNVGTEAYKGTATIRQTAQMLEMDTRINYVGFIEGDNLLEGKANVIVQDGFSGNIALKTLEGAVKNLQILLKKQHSLFNPEQYNGASLLGLQSVVVKSHGGANMSAFYYAILNAAKQVRSHIPQQIAKALTINSFI
ncbi:phosphate acyltransferase [Actinobacillus delphinicola]|uniref:phosphate acyltransferase PlsX n=1 Tax=Actinobacillus delphinicola TaxID=51161 RepID=UPI002441BC36|nr:phosphate acyltransferase PlsX [Actinobacillus delphinicola]MDG6897083.1 phosphate acyltransferase [Actinobacillus delphinicola]